MAALYLLALLFLSDWLRFTDEITLGTQFDLTCLPNVIKMCLLSKAMSIGLALQVIFKIREWTLEK